MNDDRRFFFLNDAIELPPGYGPAGLIWDGGELQEVSSWNSLFLTILMLLSARNRGCVVKFLQNQLGFQPGITDDGLNRAFILIAGYSSSSEKIKLLRSMCDACDHFPTNKIRVLFIKKTSRKGKGVSVPPHKH